MSREYTVQGENLTITGASTLVFVNPPAARAIEIVRAWASQSGTTTQAQIRIQIGTKASAFPTLTSTTPQKIKTSDPASLIVGGTAGAAGTAGVNASAEGAGTFTPLYSDAFNNVAGWLWTPNAFLGETLIFSGADSLGCALKLAAAPASLSGWTFGITYREIG